MMLASPNCWSTINKPIPAMPLLLGYVLLASPVALIAVPQQQHVERRSEFPLLDTSAIGTRHIDLAPESNGGAPSTNDTNTGPFRWPVAFREAMLYTGVMHAFRYSTEAGTRDATRGPWLKNYASSIGELRGWGDGDPFVTNYVAHPLEGAIFGFIEQQNDPQYRRVVWGSGRDYWVSRLRALSFSAVMSTQWKIGPASEASLGNVQLHEYPGFVDFVVTPTVGIVLMMGEDAADRYLISALENRTANTVILMLVRCFLNPSRTFANLMAFKEPWYRETRFGIFGANHATRRELVGEYQHGAGGKIFEFRPTNVKPVRHLEFSSIAPVQLEVSSHYEHFLGSGNCVGGGGSGAARIYAHWQVIADLSGCKYLNLPKNHSGDSTMYLGGVRWSPWISTRVSPYLQAQIGGRRVTYEIVDVAKRKELQKEWNDGKGTLPHYPERSDWSIQQQSNGFAVSAGGGVNVVINRALAWQVGDFAYTHSWLGAAETPIRAENGVRLSSSLVLRVGTW